MKNAAAAGIEVPCRQRLGKAAELLLLSRTTILHRCAERAGRLRPARSLGRALNQLLADCEERLRKRLRALPHGRQWLADVLVANYRHWERRVRRQYLTPHHLRADDPDRFCCWSLPVCAWARLQAQLAQPLERTPAAERLTLVLRVPLTPCMRTHDPVAAYLHAPSRYLPGPWCPIPAERLYKKVWQGKLMVVVV